MNGVTSAATLLAGAAPGAWISIFGSNLATKTSTAGTPDLVDGYYPKTFAGATVTVDNKPAYISFASPTQLNVEIPSDAASGGVTVTVTTSAGSASAPVNMQPIMPGFFTASNYIPAVRPIDSTVINGTGAPAAGYSTAAAARPGDILEIYATGLGPTKTAVPANSSFWGTIRWRRYPS